MLVGLLTYPRELIHWTHVEVKLQELELTFCEGKRHVENTSANTIEGVACLRDATISVGTKLSVGRWRNIRVERVKQKGTGLQLHSPVKETISLSL